MVLTEAWRVDFDDAAKVAEWYYTPAALPGSVGHVRLSTDGVDDFVEIEFGRRDDAVGFATDAASTGEAKMLADTTYPAGTVGFCFDTDPAKHGRYTKVANGDWGTRQGNIDDRAWNDPNHVRIAWLELLFQSWSEAADAYAPNDGGGPYPDKLGWPNIPDLRGAEIRYEMRAKNLILGEHAKIVQHFQTRVDSQNFEEPTTVPWVNALQIADPISDQLMLGRGGFYASNPVRGVRDSGWRTVTVPLNPYDHEWQQLGSVEGRNGLVDDGDPVNLVNYVVSPPDEFLADWTGNAYMVVAHKVVDDDSKVTPPDDDVKIKGILQIRSVSIWTP